MQWGMRTRCGNDGAHILWKGILTGLLAGIWLSVVMLVPVVAAREYPETVSDLAKRLTPHLQARETHIVERYAGPVDALFSQLDQLVSEAVRGDDYLRFNLNAWHMTATGYPGDVTLVLQMEYLTSAEEEQRLTQALTEEMSLILADADSDRQIVRAVHETIRRQVGYDTSLQSYSAVAGWFGGHTVCQGYSLLTFQMLQMAGIPSRILMGNLAGGAHAWNLVELDGEWLHLDVTNDDASGTDRYYLLTDQEIRKEGFQFDMAERARLIAPNVPDVHLPDAAASVCGMRATGLSLWLAPCAPVQDWRKDLHLYRRLAGRVLKTFFIRPLDG